MLHGRPARAGNVLSRGDSHPNVVRTGGTPLSRNTESIKRKRKDRRGATAFGPGKILTELSYQDNTTLRIVNTCCGRNCFQRRTLESGERRVVRSQARELSCPWSSDSISGRSAAHVDGSRDAKTRFVFNQSTGLPMS